jgi:hypothetical protein
MQDAIACKLEGTAWGCGNLKSHPLPHSANARSTTEIFFSPFPETRQHHHMLHYKYRIDAAFETTLKHIGNPCARSLSNTIKCDMNSSHCFYLNPYCRPF